MTLSELIQRCLEIKEGDKEFALFRYDDGTWSAEIGNPDHHVCLGETTGEYSSEGSTPEIAIEKLIDIIKNDIK